jgi:hypothetical protein
MTSPRFSVLTDAWCTRHLRWRMLRMDPRRVTAERVQRALETGEPLLLSLRPSEPACDRAADYDRLLGGAP